MKNQFNQEVDLHTPDPASPHKANDSISAANPRRSEIEEQYYEGMTNDRPVSQDLKMEGGSESTSN